MNNNPYTLEIDNITVKLAENTVIKNLSISLKKGQIGCLIGKSAGGKTTLLKAIAGFYPVNNGCIKINGQLISSNKYTIPTEKRNVGMFFQDYALFPHLNVLDNIVFGLFKWDKNKKKQRATELLDLFNLGVIAKKFPHQISGGQQQRVALARALAPMPSILLLDEPFSHLDFELKERLLIDLHQILQYTQTTSLIVSHDQREAFALADLVGVLINGQITQWTRPYEIYHKPQNRFIADFVGEGAIVPGKLISDHIVQTELGMVSSTFTLKNCPGLNMEVLVRPSDIELQKDSNLSGILIFKSFNGDKYIYTLRLQSGFKIYMYTPTTPEYQHEVGQKICFRLKNKQLPIFAPTIYYRFNQ